MTPDSLKSLLALLAAGAIGIATLAAVGVAIRTDQFDDPAWKTLATLWVALLCGGAAGAGLRLVERRDLTAVGWAGLAIGVASFIVFAVVIWNENLWDENEDIIVKLLATSLALVVAALLVASLRPQLVLADRRMSIVYYVAAGVIAFTALTAVVLLWAWELPFLGGAGGQPSERAEDLALRLMLALFALSVGAYLATPFIERALTRRSH